MKHWLYNMAEQELYQKFDVGEISKLLKDHKSKIERETQDMIDREMAELEIKLKLLAVGEEGLEMARIDTENFKKKMWSRAREIARKNGTTGLEEYKKLIDFI